jgi:hypothetical protein
VPCNAIVHLYIFKHYQSLWRIAIPTVDKITSLDKFRVPVGNQEIELQQIEFEAGGVPFLRLRIREHRRFTIFDLDPVPAARWAETMTTCSRQALADAANQQAGGGQVCDEP